MLWIVKPSRHVFRGCSDLVRHYRYHLHLRQYGIFDHPRIPPFQTNARAGRCSNRDRDTVAPGRGGRSSDGPIVLADHEGKAFVVRLAIIIIFSDDLSQFCICRLQDAVLLVRSDVHAASASNIQDYTGVFTGLAKKVSFVSKEVKELRATISVSNSL